MHSRYRLVDVDRLCGEPTRRDCHLLKLGLAPQRGL